MSKVHTTDHTPKSKLFRRNRRIESKKKEKQRREISKYSYGYWLGDTECIGVYKTRTVPESKKAIGHYEHIHIPQIIDGEIQYVPRYKFVVDQEIIVPAHTEKYRVSHYYKDRKKPIVKKSRLNKKYWRKLAARQFRYKNKDFGNGSNYKKDFDIAWMID